MYRFYTTETFQEKKTIQISDKSEIHHIKSVLRLKKNSTIQLFNGREEAEGFILRVSPGEIEFQITHVIAKTTHSTSIILACAIPKKGKFETIIEKTTELGVDEIIPIQTERTEVILKGDRKIAKQQRFEKVALNASKQSKRRTIPVIQPVMTFKTAVESLLQNSVVLMPSLFGESRPLLRVLDEFHDLPVISILIGPEGDFTPSEYAWAHQAGCLPVSLGSPVLKVETAAITAVGVVSLCFNG